MSALTDYYSSQDSSPQSSIAGEDTSGLPLIPEHASYLVGADNHQLGNTGSSIFDPSTWGDTADRAFKFSVSTLTRAVVSTFNGAIAVGELAGVANKEDEANTYDWLQGMDNDLGQYYKQNRQSVDVAGDVVGMFVPGIAGIKVLNWAQKGIAAATEGRAGWALASHFGTLPTKQALFAKQAAADIANSNNAFSLINANLAKSLGAGYAQNALEFAAFDVAAATYMKDSPLFTDHDVSDVAYNALLGGGMIGAGIMGTATAARTIMDLRKAGNAITEATHPYRTVLMEPAAGTPANEALAIHLNNIEAIPTVGADDPLRVAKLKGTNETRNVELTKGREASHALTRGDAELGNTLFDTIVGGSSEDASNKLAGAVTITRAARTLAEEKAETSAVQYMGFFGDDAGVIYDAAPTLRIADRSKNEAEVLVRVSTYKHAQKQDWSVVKAGADQDAIEARYIHAQEYDFNPEVAIGTHDIPYLERAYQEMSTNGLASITLRDKQVLDKSGLFNYLEDIKLQEADKLQRINEVAVGENVLTTEDIAKLVNVSPSLLRGERNIANPLSDLMASQSAAEEYTKKQIQLGNWRAEKGTIKTYLRPHFAKIVYDTEQADMISGHEISGMVALKEQQRIYRQQALNVTNTYLGERAADYPERIPGYLLVGANRESVGSGLLTSQNGNYKTLASYVQQIGATLAGLLQSKAEALSERFSAAGHKVLNDADASTEFWSVAHQLRKTPEKYMLIGNELKNIKQVKYEAELKSAADPTKVKPPIFEDTTAPISIPLNTEGMRGFANEWNSYHKEHRTHVTNLRTSQGLQTQGDLDHVFYIPPVDSRKYPHFAFVVDDSIGGTGHVSMLHANSASELEALASKVPTDRGLKVLYKEDSERWHKAMRDYDYDLGINENYINTALKRSGASAPYFAVTDSNKLWNDLMDWRKNQDAGLARDMIEHRYNAEFAELRRQGAAYDLAETSKKGYVSDIIKAKSSNPYTDYIKSALYVSKEGVGLPSAIWSATNRLAETSVSSVVSRLGDAMDKAKTPTELAAVNKELQRIGVSVYEDAATYALANHAAPKAVLSSFIRGANSLLSFTMLRSDPMNALNNGFGHAVLYGAELPRMMKEVMASGPAGEAAMRDLAYVTVPGTTSQIVSPAKLAANAYGAWWNKIVGGVDEGKLSAEFKAKGWIPSYTDQFKAMVDNLTLHGNELGADLDTRLGKAVEASKKFGTAAEKITGNKFVEEMNRFVAAHTAKQVTDAAISAGTLAPELQDSIINTFVNRTQGVMLANQRPLMFKGAIGQAVGLFQTYQFNMLQQMFRYIGDGDRKTVATLLGMQGSIYGLNGLPAFNAMNNYIVGNAAGNISHKDVVSTVYDTAGKEAGNWLMYGVSSNFLVHPDWKVNMYSRGDINPRQVTVIPTNVADVPIVGAATKFFGSMYEAAQKINKGGDVWGSFLQGLEHSGVSRPLSGLAQTLEATNNPLNKVYSTDNAGNIVMENDFFTAMTAARLVGAKPLDEAIALDAFHRTQVYHASQMKKIENLGEAIKVSTAGGNIPTPEQVHQFVSEYMKAGGDQKHFAKYYNRQVINANRSKVNQMIDNTTKSGSDYYQKIMGGYQLQDFVNSPGK